MRGQTLLTLKIFGLGLLLFWGQPQWAQAASPCDQEAVTGEARQTLSVRPGAKASALVVHGLNNSSQMMSDVEASLQEMGLNTLNLTLYGHHGQFSEFQAATQEDWLEDVLSGYCELRNLGLPVIFVGYSLGGFLGPYLSTQWRAVEFKAFVFLAPALVLHRPLDWLARLRILGRRFSLPSRAPKDYRVYSKVPVSAYWEFLEAKEDFAEADLERLRVPGLVLIDPRDELVSAEGLRQFISEQDLDDYWKFVEVKSKHSYRHIIVDHKTLPAGGWSQLNSFVGSLVSEK